MSHPGGTCREPGTADDVNGRATAYLHLANGDLGVALLAAVADLMDVEQETAFRTQALDQWVSRGYLQGRASTELSGPRREFWRRRIASACAPAD